MRAIATDLSDDVQAQLAEEAYPFTPCFVPERCLVSPVDERTQRLLDRMRTVGVNVWPGPVSM